MLGNLEFVFGPEVTDQGSRFRLWSPTAEQVELVVHRVVPPPEGGEGPGEGAVIPLEPHADGWCLSDILPLGAGSRYAFRINGEVEVPDPASRFQPAGVHGPSEVVDLRRLHDDAAAPFAGRRWQETILYELHTGTFSEEGSFTGVRRRLDHLANLGVTAVELMPIAAFPGERNWGYDGVLPYAPAAAYGTPRELAALIAAAHRRGLQLFLDVVYNHFGPEGNYLHLYAAPFFTERFTTPWGAAIDFSVPEVRRFFLENALYWTLAYGFDGLRVDAVHAIRDESAEHFVQELARRVREEVNGRSPERDVHVVLENEENEAWRLREATAQWNDDIHHLLHCLITEESEGYYQDYVAAPHAGLAKSAAEGFYFQGGPSKHRGGAPRGSDSRDLSPTRLVAFSQNHDQIGNRAFGERPTTLAPSIAAEEFLEAFILLIPQTPMLFMGEEWGSRRRFLFFCDYRGELADAVREGRRKEFAGFAAFADPETRSRIPDPNAPETADNSRLDWGLLYPEERSPAGRRDEDSSRERRRHEERRATERFELVRELIAVRRRELEPWLGGVRSGSYLRGEEEAFRVRWPLGERRFWSVYCNATGEPRRLPDFATPPEQRLVWRSPGYREQRPWPAALLPPWTVIATMEREE